MNSRGMSSVVVLALLVIFLTTNSQVDLSQLDSNLSTLTEDYQDLKNQSDGLNQEIQNSRKEKIQLEDEITSYESKISEMQQLIAVAEERKSKSIEVVYNGELLILQPISDWKGFTATYYNAGLTSTGKQPGSKNYGMTASGRPVEAGITASVDRSIIPMGTWFQVKYPNGKIEIRRADDTGSAVRGHKIDVYEPLPNSELNILGKKKVEVRILGFSN